MTHISAIQLRANMTNQSPRCQQHHPRGKLWVPWGTIGHSELWCTPTYWSQW